LLKKIEESETLRTDIVELQKENQQLRELLNFSERITYNNLPARVIGKDPGNLFATITLNKGKKHGVRADMPVVAVQDHSLEENDLLRNIGLVGKVLHAGMFTSVVQPLFDRNYYAAARLQRTRYEGLVEGSGRNDLDVTMRYVNKDARNYLRHGDLVITSGMNSIYPKGIHIGTVSIIHGKPYETSLDLQIDPAIDFSRLEYVFILEMDNGE
jgi:rod shape-determining protein MreC